MTSFVKKFNAVLCGLLFFCFIYFQKKINSFIEIYLTADPAYNVWYLKLITAAVFTALAVKLFQRLVLEEYLPSKSEYFFASVLFFGALFYRLDLNTGGWNFHEIAAFNNYSIKYLDLIPAGIFLFFLFRAFRFIFPSAKKNVAKNFLLGDDPVDNQNDDRLGYHAASVKLAEILSQEHHKKSLSIGLIGPWGNGKSSVIEMTLKIIRDKASPKYRDIITIHFLPYLNHSENDIINEFFTALSSRLAPHNGKLSNHIIDYAGKLTDLYQNKSIGSFLEDQVTSFSKFSANDLYRDINDMLEKIDRKIVVFIDDLDRLNQIEILQTLKLIRNTANFYNIIFVAAMDKDYVIRRLTEDRNILDTKFVDKFFQLEIYLPQINTDILKKFFIEQLSSPFSPSPSDFKERVQAALNDPALLFEDYIKNFRDAKRAVNQIKFEITLFKEDFSYLNMKDFINFIFFKLKFPDLITELNINKGEYLYIRSSDQTYHLKRKGSEASDSDTLAALDKEEINSLKHLQGYKIYKKIVKKQPGKKSGRQLHNRESGLMIKTLAHLFGIENKIEAQNSIKYINNFQMLTEQRIFSSFLKQSEFNNLYTLNLLSLKEELEIIYKENKIRQLLDRLSFLKTSEPSKLKRIIEYLIIIYEKYNTYGRYDSDTYILVDKFIYSLNRSWDTGQDGDYNNWINQNIFNSEHTLPETRLMLLSNIWKLRNQSKMWELSQDYIAAKTAELYKLYLSNFDNELWQVNNYDTYFVYHEIKDICWQEVNEALKDFWQRNSIELFCAQTMDLSSSSNTKLKLSGTVIQIFGSTEAFINFIKQHPDSVKPEIRDFLELYTLLQITNYSTEIEFDFENSQLMAEKIEYWRSMPGRENFDELKRTLQAVVKISDQQFGYRFISDSSRKDRYLLRSFIFEDTFYLLLNIYADDNSLRFTQFIEDIYKLHNNDHLPPLNKKNITAPDEILSDENLTVEIISIKPADQEIINYKYHRQ